MLGLLKNKSNAVLGVDISSTSVKVLELGLKGDQYVINAFSVMPLPQGAVVDNNIQAVDLVGEAIAKAVAHSKTTLNRAAVAVSGAAVITKQLDMNASLSEEEMEAQIIVEADQYIPYAIDEVALDFEVQGLNDKNPELVEVVMAACRRDNVEIREEALRIGGVTAKVVDVEAFAIERAYELIEKQFDFREPPPVFAIVDIGATKTTLNIISYGKTIYSRDQSFGGQQLTDEIQRRYGYTAEEAESSKCRGGLPKEYQSEILRPYKEALVQQVLRQVQFFLSSSAFKEVDAIALVGGGASIPGIAKMIQSMLKVPVKRVNPLADMSMAGKVNQEELAKEVPSLMVACGLAMRSFD